MPMIRINAQGDEPKLHNSPEPVWAALDRSAHADGGRDGPVIVMIHGYKYRPGDPLHCPHRHIMSLTPQDKPWRSPSWPRQLGFDGGHRDEGLAIAFGWDARGAVWQAQARAVAAGRALAHVCQALHRQNPQRPIHIVAHSMGTELALEALPLLPAGAIGRIISMTGASYRSRVLRALETPAGRAAELFNVTSRENDVFDFMYERLIAPPFRGDRAIGHGISAPNAVTVQLDCAGTLAHLERLGAPIAAPQRRVCHWSSYTRQGVLQFYSDLLRRPETLPLSVIRAGLPEAPAPRWSRLMALPSVRSPIGFAQKAG